MSIPPHEKGGSTSARVHTWWSMAAILALATGLLIGRATAPRAGTSRQASSPQKASSDLARCVKVLDGDTIRVKWRGSVEDVRILGIDCPETRNGHKLTRQAKELNLEKEYVLNYGKIAKKTANSWLLGRDVTLVFPNNEVKRDAFGRLLAYVEDHGVDIGERLLAGGNAFIWDSEHPRRSTYDLIEAEAKKKRKGIWRGL